jgi:3-hydroxyacyl-CoA dehydrogenase/enoyl-CoA hydratase/3-hydroxybutyryl-CoA epimerase
MTRLSLSGDGIALVAPTASAGEFGMADLEELETTVARIASDPDISGAVFMSAGDFCRGNDPAWWRVMSGAVSGAASRDAGVRALMAAAGRLPKALRTLETCGKPVVAAISGSCFGAGLDLALACHHRIVAEAPGTRLGFPEVAIGMTPVGGGTQRLPRLIGAKAALELLLRGSTVDAATARERGLVDEIVPSESLLDRARRWLAAPAPAVQPWDAKGFEPPGGLPYGRDGMQTWPVLNAIYRKETHDNYEARRAVLSSVYEGLCVRGMDAGLAIDLRYVTRVLLSPQSDVMVRSLRESVAELEAGARRPRGIPASAVRRVGIVGAGFMGAGIAVASAAAGLGVLLVDRDVESAERARTSCAETLAKAAARGLLAPGTEAEALSRIAVADFAALGDVDVAIEAVFENREVKADVLPRIEAGLKDDAILASNTSTLPITSLAAYAARPERFIGIHFFSPVDRMRLVEIIPGRGTSQRTQAVAFDFVRRLGKTPIVVNDSRGFYTSRVVMTHKKEGIRMLEEGVPPALIENAGRAAGMPVGPLALADEVALDLSWKILAATRRDLGESYETGPIDRVLEEMVERRGRFGRKNRKGFYDYPADGRKRLWPGLSDICPPRDPSEFSFAELQERLLLIQALETVRCFEEGVLADVREADVGAILGFGFAPFTGGPLSYIDAMGTGVFLGKCRAYMRRFGNHYRPPKLLVEMAKKGETFYGRFSPKEVVA